MHNLDISTNLLQCCTCLPGVGKAMAGKLAKCGIHNIQDLLLHLPFRYQDRTRITPIECLKVNDWCVVVGSIAKTTVQRGRRSSMYCYIDDKTGILTTRFFHFNRQQLQSLQAGQTIKVFGEVRSFNNKLLMIHPEYKIIQDDTPCPVEETLTPIYPATAGLSQKRIRDLIHLALKKFQPELKSLEWMDSATLEKLQFASVADALTSLHNPQPDVSLQDLESGAHSGLQRLAFDELLAQKITMQFARNKRRQLQAAKLNCDLELTNKFLQELPFQLTAAQSRVQQEINQDMQQTSPMQRLVQGDVGSGKTVIAALASLNALAHGYQVAIMAPTDILSEQHALTISKWLSPLGFNVRRLSGKMKAKEKRDSLQAIANADCQVVIGTHALFQTDVEFAKLGLIIIDEQHRFGVEQRSELNQKGQVEGQHPHQLLMTATPIPRTLAMADFAHLDLSAIDELPPGRTPITTAVLPQHKEQQIIERLKTALAAGRQAYWVCTLIDESENLQCINATQRAADLQQQLPTHKIGLVHGRIKPAEKEQIMQQFKSGELDLLVATTVIEVGVDVPNASLMIIENAERLGLSQLHQLRGRVGRGNTQSHCLLLYQHPISNHSQERLQIMRATNDGFAIAERDLQLRGCGEILGKQQTGYQKFKIARLDRDHGLLPQVKKTANALIQESLDTATAISKRWLNNREHLIIS